MTGEGNQNATKHGAYSVIEHGPQTPAQRSRHAELVEVLEEREGIRQTLVDQVATCVLLREMGMSYIALEAQAGTPLIAIPMLDKIVSFLNTERLGLLALEKMTKDNGRHNAGRVLEAIRMDHGNE